MRQGLLVAAMLSAVCGACSTAQDPAVPSVGIATSSTQGPERGTPVVAGRPARVYVLAGFKEADCSVLTPDIKITGQPTKGTVSLQPNQMTNLQATQSGKCVGKPMPGTGIYYTARAGSSGSDSFTITATSGTGAPMTKTFGVRIVD